VGSAILIALAAVVGYRKYRKPVPQSTLTEQLLQ
jgi:hypothetical protein